MPQTVPSQVVGNFPRLCILCPCPPLQSVPVPAASPSPRALWETLRQCCCHVSACVIPAARVLTIPQAAATPTEHSMARL